MAWIFLRHGEALHNVMAAKNKSLVEQNEEVLKIADYQIGLTLNGILQARSAGVAIRKKYGPFVQAVHTGYVRSADTLKYILEAYTQEESSAIKVSRNFYLRERNSGYTTSMTKVEASRLFPWIAEHKRVCGRLFYQPPGGESIIDLIKRVDSGLSPLLRTTATQDNVLFVVHGWTMTAIRFLLEDWTYGETEKYLAEPPVANCSALIYSYDSTLGRLVYDRTSSFC